MSYGFFTVWSDVYQISTALKRTCRIGGLRGTVFWMMFSALQQKRYADEQGDGDCNDRPEHEGNDKKRVQISQHKKSDNLEHDRCRHARTEGRQTMVIDSPVRNTGAGSAQQTKKSTREKAFFHEDLFSMIYTATILRHARIVV